MTADLDRLRSTALAQIDRAHRWFLAAIFGATLFEGLFLAGMLYYLDFRNPLHMLIFCGVGLIYMPIVLGLVALGAWVNKCTLRVLARLDD
jgi:hypothetical protein